MSCAISEAPRRLADEEAGIVEPYRTTRKAPKPQGQGLNDLYVRFWRIAERTAPTQAPEATTAAPEGTAAPDTAKQLHPKKP